MGQTVEVGDTIVVLEAMKMENNVAADIDGTVTEIKVEAGQSVAAGDVVRRHLCRLTPSGRAERQDLSPVPAHAAEALNAELRGADRSPYGNDRAHCGAPPGIWRCLESPVANQPRPALVAVRVAADACAAGGQGTGGASR